MSADAASPYFSLPDAFPQEGQSYDYGNFQVNQGSPIMTLSCNSCNTTVGDSTTFVCAIRSLGGIALESLVNVTLGGPTQTESEEVSFDEYCMFRPINCAKCRDNLGRMYVTDNGQLGHIRGKYIIYRTKIQVYTVGSNVPPLQPGESEEIMRQLHPEPDEIVHNLTKVMSLLIYLKEEQDNIVRELKRVGERCGIDDIDVGNNGGVLPMDGAEGEGDGWKDRIARMEAQIEELRRAMMVNSDKCMSNIRQGLNNGTIDKGKKSSAASKGMIDQNEQEESEGEIKPADQLQSSVSVLSSSKRKRHEEKDVKRNRSRSPGQYSSAKTKKLKPVPPQLQSNNSSNKGKPKRTDPRDVHASITPPPRANQQRKNRYIIEASDEEDESSASEKAGNESEEYVLDRKSVREPKFRKTGNHVIDTARNVAIPSESEVEDSGIVEVEDQEDYSDGEGRRSSTYRKRKRVSTGGSKDRGKTHAATKEENAAIPNGKARQSARRKTGGK